MIARRQGLLEDFNDFWMIQNDGQIWIGSNMLYEIRIHS